MGRYHCLKTNCSTQTPIALGSGESDTKNFPAEASASSTGPSASGHDADVPMTDDEARGRLRERDDEQQDPPRRKRYKHVGKLTVDEDPADYLGDVGELDWSEERLMETDRVETEKALDQLLEQGVVQDVPADSVTGVKQLTTRWEKCWRMREGKWQYKVRLLGGSTSGRVSRGLVCARSESLHEQDQCRVT